MKSKIVEIEGRKFKFKFSIEPSGILFISIYEVHELNVLFLKFVYYEKINKRPTIACGDPIDACYKIAYKFLHREKIRKEMYRKVDEF